MSDQKPPRAETIFDDPSLALKAKKQDGMEGEPTLRPAVYENNPRLVVKTKVPNDRNNGKIEAAMSGRAFNAVLRAVEEIAENPAPDKIFMDNKGHRFVDKKRDPNPSIMSCILVEKDDKGVIALTISAGKSRPLIPFYFLDDTYHNFRDGNGEPMSLARASKLYALGWVDELRHLMNIVRAANYVKPAWMTRFENNNQNGGQRQGGGGYGGGNGGGGYQGNGGNGGYQGNRNNGGGGGYQGNNNSAPAPSVSGGDSFNFDDDVPM